MQPDDAGKGQESYPNPFEQEAPTNPFLGEAGSRGGGASDAPPPPVPSRVVSEPKKKQEPSPGGQVWPPPQSAGASSVASPSDMEKSLSEREREVQEREERVRRQEERLSRMQLNNYPPCYPMVYNNIADDVPRAYQNLCRLGFTYYHLHVAALVFNWICGLISFSVTCFFIGFIYIIVGMWVAWHLQYRRLYKALIKGSDTSVFFFLANFFFGVGFSITMAVGIPPTCGCGLWTALDAFSHKKDQAIGIMYMVSFLLWTLNGLWGLYIFKRTLHVWRQMGGSVERAKKEAAREGSKHAASAAVSSYQ